MKIFNENSFLIKKEGTEAGEGEGVDDCVAGGEKRRKRGWKKGRRSIFFRKTNLSFTN